MIPSYVFLWSPGVRLTFLLEILIALTVLHKNELMTFNILYFNY